jgi:molybdate transport system substrate-binding protein
MVVTCRWADRYERMFGVRNLRSVSVLNNSAAVVDPIRSSKMENLVKSRQTQFVWIALVVAIMAAGLALVPTGVAAQGAELRVLCSDGMEPVVTELTPRIERSIGAHLNSQFESSKNLVDKIQGGEGFDVAILTTGTIEDLIKQGKIATGSNVPLARSGLGVGVRAGTAKPDVSTPEAMKKTLLKAKSITFNSTGATSLVITKMFETLGITDQVKSKLMPDPVSGAAQKMVAEGKAEIVLILTPEVTRFPGVVYVGPLPGNLQSNINFAAGIAANAKDPQKAKALIKYLASPAAVPSLKAKHMEPL